MRCLNRNKRKIWYALYKGKIEIADENGNRTGQYSIEYARPVSLMANVSPANGAATTQQFGINTAYSKVIVHENPDLGIDESSILWVDRKPKFDISGNLAKDANDNEITPHDYIVSQIARSANSVSIAIKKVDLG